MATIATVKSAPISTNSRLGAALIIMSGGRHIESMRTHGISKAFSYSNLKRVVRAINSHPSLVIEFDSSPASLAQYAAEFEARSDMGLFKYCVLVVDGLALACTTPRRKKHGGGLKVTNTSRFHSGSKKKNVYEYASCLQP